jgi:HEAT repeat protein
MRLQIWLSLVLLVFAGCTFAIRSRHETSAEFLRRHGIEISQKGLIAALKNSDPEIRDNAAAELANEKAVSAVPALKAALATEKDPEIQVNLAESLARLGDKDGFVALKHFCDTAPPNARLKATLYMLRFNDESCLTAVLSVLRSKPKGDHDYMATAMSLIPSFHNLGNSEATELFVLTAKQLADPSPYIRIAASQVLAKMDGVDVIPPLEKAIADETDPVVRTAMQAQLDKVKAKDKH